MPNAKAGKQPQKKKGSGAPPSQGGTANPQPQQPRNKKANGPKPAPKRAAAKVSVPRSLAQAAADPFNSTNPGYLTGDLSMRTKLLSTQTFTVPAATASQGLLLILVPGWESEASAYWVGHDGTDLSKGIGTKWTIFDGATALSGSHDPDHLSQLRTRTVSFGTKVKYTSPFTAVTGNVYMANGVFDFSSAAYNISTYDGLSTLKDLVSQRTETRSRGASEIMYAAPWHGSGLSQPQQRSYRAPAAATQDDATADVILKNLRPSDVHNESTSASPDRVPVTRGHDDILIIAENPSTSPLSLTVEFHRKVEFLVGAGVLTAAMSRAPYEMGGAEKLMDAKMRFCRNQISQ